MSLLKTLKKATSLLIEMPDTEARPLSSRDFPDMDSLDTELPEAARYTPTETSGARSVEEIVRQSEGPNLDQIAIAPDAAPAQQEGAPLDFAAIYRAAQLPETGFGAEAMLETLHSLPPELPLETRRATVRAMLSTLGKTTGATPENVVADASRKLAALAAFERFMEERTQQTVSLAQEEIAALEAQIEAKRAAILGTKNELARVQDECERESEKLDEVLEFFSLDSGTSKLAPATNAGENSAPSLA